MTESSAKFIATGQLVISREESETLEAKRAQILETSQPVDTSDLLERFSTSHPKSLSILEKGGIHPHRISILEDPLTGELCSEDFSNIGEHSLVVGHVASRICDALITVGALGKTQKHHVVHRALIHDANKALEILTQRAIARIVAEQSSHTFERVRKLKENLRDTRISLDNAGTEAGHENLKLFLDADLSAKRVLCRGKLEQKIVRLADDMTASLVPTLGSPARTYITSPDERIILSQFHLRYPQLYREGLGIKRSLSGSKLVELTNIHAYRPNTVVLGSYVSLQVFAAERISEEIKSYLDPSDRRCSTTFVRELTLSTGF